MPIEYLFPLENNQMDHILICVLSHQITDLEKLEESHQIVVEMAMTQ